MLVSVIRTSPQQVKGHAWVDVEIDLAEVYNTHLHCQPDWSLETKALTTVPAGL